MLPQKTEKQLKPLQIWKKSVLGSYNILSVHLLEWPTLTLEVLGGTRQLDDNMIGIRLLYGTDTNDGEHCVEQDYLYMADVPIPSDTKKVDINTYCEETGEAGGTGLLLRRTCRPTIYHKIIHDTEVNVARACPVNQDIIASRGNGKTVNVFNRLNQPGLGGTVTAVDAFKTDATFETKDEGWGLCFEGRKLYTGDSTGCLASWDVPTAPSEADMYELGTSINDLHTSNLVNDVILASCEDGSIRLFDTRDLRKSAVNCIYKNPINASCFSNFESRLIFGASGDGTLVGYDLRMPKTPLFNISAHNGPCTFVASSPFDAGIVATGGDDGIVNIWNITNDGTSYVPKHIFSHNGHTAPITGLCYSPDVPGLISTASEDHTIMTWQPNM